MKVVGAGIATAAFVVLLLATYALHMRFARVDVVLYAAVFDAVLAATIVAVALHVSRFRGIFTGMERALLLAVWLLGGYAFAISVPTVIDRSLSFYILEKLDQRGGGIRADRMADVFVHEYLPEHQLVAVRLTEQLESGTIRIDHGCIRLTARGRRLARMSSYFRAHFLPVRRLLMGRYTDALTDPFRESVGDVNYTCR